ncbi:MAG: N-acetylmuramic acid 6-phosphate etherase [Saprospiraceae bacterium]|jgi:N-acetylmuramic acid 6-phosphate etherase|nr:N-acetylmuramic acid 6-phosphate etherase [Saprospiraceae bacterium]
MERITESPSIYRNLEQKSTIELLTDINTEDQKVALAVQKAIPMIVPLIDAIAEKMSQGGRLFYIGAGTSGRLGVLDASECPPTYGVPKDWVIGIIAGGDTALRNPVENAEDSVEQAWKDLCEYDIDSHDVLVGIAASGTTPYVINGLKMANDKDIITGSISCNPSSPLSDVAKFPIEVIVGPEYVTGSTRMKSGTAQKLVLNMISSSVMIKLGRVLDNRMVDMQLSNKKLVDRGVKMVIEKTGLEYDVAKELLLTQKSVRNAVASYQQSNNMNNH